MTTIPPIKEDAEIGKMWIRPPLIRVRIVHEQSQDAVGIMLLRSQFDIEEQGYKQWFAKEFVWQEYHGFDILDLSKIMFAGHEVKVIGG